LKKEVEYFLNKIVKNTKIKFDKKYSEKKKYLMLIDIYKEVKEDYFTICRNIYRDLGGSRNPNPFNE